MAEGRIITRQEHTQSKLQEKSGAYSGSVLPEGADNRSSPVLKGTDTNSPPLYIVGDTSAFPHQPIPFNHVENLIQAAGYARVIDKPLYHHLTIRWPTGDW